MADKKMYIRGIGTYLPDRILTNADLEKIVDTTDEWIVSRTGIRERHIAADGQYTSDLAAAASLRAIADAGLSPNDIDAILVATVTPDTPFPSTAAFVQQKIGVSNCCPCIGIEVGCSGVMYGLELGTGLLHSGSYRNILVISADKLTAITDWQDRSTCVLFGDGAAAFVLTVDSTRARMLVEGIHIAADGSGAEFLIQPGGGCRMPATDESVKNRQHFLKMNGAEVFKCAVKHMAAALDSLFARCGISADQVRFFAPHQANMRIIEATAKYVNLPMERFLTVIHRTGNTSSASVGIAMDDAIQDNRLQKDDRVVLLSFGAGMTSGAALLRWIG
jgi:3-oxoacyl-[acyl-carrier-protein] synthase-3